MTVSNRKASILVVDDAPDTLEMLDRTLTAQGEQVFTAPGAAQAIKILEATPIDLVITDLKMPGVDGLDLIRHVRENFTDTEVIMITGYPSVEVAVKAIKTGADEYLAKPFTDEELFTAVRQALNKLHEKKKIQAKLRKIPESSYGIIGESRAIQQIFSEIKKTSSNMATVMITGESGTGKELVARAIHYTGPRSSAPFIPVNCGGIPEELLETELFGYVKGAFTGASESRAGFFQTADGGTIFLDEVSNTSLSMQAKLLRVLQDKEVFMVGSRRPLTVDVRIIAATNKDLQGLIKKEVFREDLFYRLNVITINIPPLRERVDDILLLINHFATRFSGESGKPKPEFTAKALHILKNYYWPGNVRELENVVQRLVVMADRRVIDVPDLPSLMRFSALRDTGFNRTLAEVEAEYIRHVLESVGDNKTLAAKILNIDRKTLRTKLKKIQEIPFP